MRSRVFILVGLAVLGHATAGTGAGRFHLGRSPTDQELRGWDIDVRADGQGLPAGRGSVEDGQQVYAELCAGCHGPHGEGSGMDRLAGGLGTLDSEHPIRTVGSYWPYATTLYDYIRRAMPFNAPQSLSPDQVYAVSAYVLFLNGILPQNATLDANNLPKIVMPNAAGFATSDPRPDVQNKLCLKHCRP